MQDRTWLVFTSEHGGNRIPARYRYLFHADPAPLATHRGYDLGSLKAAKALSEDLKAPLFFSETTRLLVDLNRSVGHRAQFSEFSRDLDEDTKARLLAEYYYPYRRQIEQEIAARIRRGARIVHISVHSFTPVMNEKVRRAEVALLYDPRRRYEKRFCDHWHAALSATDEPWCVRRNYPYKGVADGFTSYLRKVHRDRDYIGVELELNQAWVARADANRRRWLRAIAESLRTVLKQGL